MIVGAAILLFWPAIVIPIGLLVYWLMEGSVEQAIQGIFTNSEKLATVTSFQQLLAGILVLLIVGGFGVAALWAMLWMLLWMIGIILLLILRELSEINKMQR